MKNALLIALSLMVSSSAFAESARWSESCSANLKGGGVIKFERLAVDSGSIQNVSLNGRGLNGDAAYLNMAESDYEMTPAGTVINMMSRKETTTMMDTTHEEGYRYIQTNFDRNIRVVSVSRELAASTGIKAGAKLTLKCGSVSIVPDSAQ